MRRGLLEDVPISVGFSVLLLALVVALLLGFVTTQIGAVEGGLTSQIDLVAGNVNEMLSGVFN